MNNDLQHQSQVRIKENRITLFYFFNCVIDVEQLNEQTLKEIGLPEQINQLINTRFSNQKLWTKHAYNITRDIKQSVHALFHTKQDFKPIITWQLNKLAIKILNGKQVGKEKGTVEAQEAYAKSGLVLQLTKAGQQRLVQNQESVTKPQIMLENIHYHQFKTGFSVAMIEFSATSLKRDNTCLRVVERTLVR